MDSRLRSGYLLLADISGYTAFLTGNELQHAHEIIEDLTRAIIAALTAPMRLVKLEGDAVFAYAPGEAFETSERVMELVERCYAAFADYRTTVMRKTSCECTACANIGSLDLKFLVHFGQFVVQDIAGTEDLGGPDVILVHRLLKNSVKEKTGVEAYALYTAAVLGRVGRPLPLIPHVEAYESFGDVACGVDDLRAVYASMVEARRQKVREEDAVLSTQIRVAAPPSVAWDWWNDPKRTLLWTPGLTGFETVPNARGRAGAGGGAHCAHGRGRSTQTFLDWRPFEYLTIECQPIKFTPSTPPAHRSTTEFIEQPDGTTLIRFRAQLLSRNPLMGFAAKAIVAPMFRRQFRTAEKRLAALIAESGTTG
jgi:hypothetical protein